MIDIGTYIEQFINWLTANFSGFFDGVNYGMTNFIGAVEGFWIWLPFYVTIAFMAGIAFWRAGIGNGFLTLFGLLFIYGMGYWDQTMQTFALVLSSTITALAIGIPLGIWSARSQTANRIIRPILDFMQTMPAFVYLIPAVLFFGLGTVPGAFATIIFAMPPVVRLTSLGIQQVPGDIVEATKAFGATSRQLLVKVQVPLAMPSILAGVNQTIMMALSMVVIASMIGAKGLGEIVLQGISQLRIGMGFEGGLAVVLLAIILDRITQHIGKSK
ncbi:glycine/betaine ABC transporter permease [Prolixibacter bellariivorans]|jgi:glycine betaine/proline transport system permease protein|uniref:Glycine/betaine ABC transporter permease n=1 Tax=Prolixibacter bellariivorans TaxID=314319 RepID=A0A5M4B3K3_9BACT|nr:proline/glycine betaine ABC transporter permease [Prolixibacter bellariivorans]GET34451.1 glycine/betaine ABC transporter permease [Prolixibacter bellariivorans]